MTHHIEQTLKVNVPASQLWKVMEDFASVEQFATTIKSSPVINGIESGLGAKRKCTFNDGSSLVEEIVAFEEGQSFTMELSEYTLPLKSMSAQMKVTPINENSSELQMSADFVVKAGPLGWLMGFLLMKPMMKGVFTKLMTGLAYHTTTGKRIGDELPTKDELTALIVN